MRAERVQARSYSQKGLSLYYRAINEFEPSQRQRVYIGSRMLVCYVVQCGLSEHEVPKAVKAEAVHFGSGCDAQSRD